MLAHGPDWLDIALTLDWGSTPALFATLDRFKRQARTLSDAQAPDPAVPITLPAGDFTWHAVVRPFGHQGYAWIIEGGGMKWLLMDRVAPCSRPSLLVHFDAEALWRHGVPHLLQFMHQVLLHHRARIVTAGVSRLDLALDVLVPQREVLHPGMLDAVVSRARHDHLHRHNRQVSGLSLGCGKMLLARIYDKGLELRSHPEKAYIRDVWGLPHTPPGMQAVRVEFQMRRAFFKQWLPRHGFEVLAEVGHVVTQFPELWAYLTRDWLRCVEDPTVKRDRQQDAAWWTLVRNGWTREPRADITRNTRTGANATAKGLEAMSIGCVLRLIAEDQTGTLPGQVKEMILQRLALALDQTPQDQLAQRLTRKQALYIPLPPAPPVVAPPIMAPSAANEQPPAIGPGVAIQVQLFPAA